MGEVGPQRPVEGAFEALDLILAVTHEGEGGRLHPPGRELGVVGAGHRPRDVHPHIPVGGRPTLCRLIEGVVERRVLEVRKPLGDGGVGLAADPEPLGGPFPVGELHDPTGHQLPFAPGVGGDDQGFDITSCKEGLHHLQLISCLLDGDLDQILGEHRQVLEVPPPPPLCVHIGIGQLDQVAEGPGDDVGIPFDIPIHAFGAPQRLGELAPHTRFLCQDKLLSHRILHSTDYTEAPNLWQGGRVSS